jgi:hypothetical protein
MEFLSEYALFLLKALTIIAVPLLGIAIASVLIKLKGDVTLWFQKIETNRVWPRWISIKKKYNNIELEFCLVILILVHA